MKLVKHAAVMILVLGLLAGMIGAVGAQDYPPASLTADGYGQAYGAPDVAVTNLGVQTSSSDVLEAYNSANVVVENVIAALVELGINENDIQTTGLYLYQDTPFNPQTGEPSETPIYRVQNSLMITVRDITMIGDVINAGVEAGANNIGGLTFSIADPAALEQEAREDAIADARERAEQLANLMGVTLGDPTIIVETNDGQFSPFPFDRAQAAMGGGGVPIQEGQLSVAVRVRVTFNIE